MLLLSRKLVKILSTRFLFGNFRGDFRIPVLVLADVRSLYFARLGEDLRSIGTSVQFRSIY